MKTIVSKANKQPEQQGVSMSVSAGTCIFILLSPSWGPTELYPKMLGVPVILKPRRALPGTKAFSCPLFLVCAEKGFSFLNFP